VSLLQHLKDSGGLGVTMEVTSGGVVRLLSELRLVEGEDHQKGLGHV
jgi:hypothetical protein